ncbi:hypothetical protein BGZ80_001671 [Entomortierella chlamydospora]|uniref:tRNA binding domain-containing protein n=1 Tax=Entomortierella chlamydospora TaxID=101097 RepID=A0A9P6SY63_9FUNG|nr:hypothetical protein BGZ80_001671 [Entomortierella chlamydospora]
MTDDIKVRDPKKMPPLLLKLSEKKAEKLHWLGVSYGLTAPLHKFWSKAGYVPVYLRQTPNDLTGEHTCVMLRTLESSQTQTQCDPMWLSSFAKDFHHRFQSLLSFQFRSFSATLALSILESARAAKQANADDEASEEDKNSTGVLVKRLREGQVSRELVDALFSAYDLKRLEGYANQVLDYHVILDLVPLVASIWFDGRVDNSEFKLTNIQAALLLAVGLQRKTIDDFEKEIGLSASQLLAFFIKMIRKFSDLFKEQKTLAYTEEINNARATISAQQSNKSTGGNKAKRDVTKEEQWDPNTEDLDDELGKEGRERLRELQKASLGDVEKMYAIAKDDSVDWSMAEAQIDKKGKSTVVSVKNPESTKKRNLVMGGTANDVLAKEAKELVRGKASRRDGGKSAKRRKV